MKSESDIRIRHATDDDRVWKAGVLCDKWGSETIVTRGRARAADKLSCLIVESGGERVGMITYEIYGHECELVTMNALERERGIGTSLIMALRGIALEHHCRGIWLITTNDNTQAMRFYQKKGFVFVAVHRDAITAARRLKPDIPEVGNDGIPVRDEIEMVYPL